MAYHKKMYLNCLYSTFGCHGPCECQRCGFDKDEAARRKAIPLTPCEDGTRHKVIPNRHHIRPHDEEETSGGEE